MTTITSSMLADMHARRQDGESVAEIAARYNVKPMTAYQRLRRAFGSVKPREIVAANDNRPDVVTRMTAHNGGCSTLSGKVPVSVVRIPTLDGHAPKVAA
ncbi:hypothetical protein B5M44_04360 [Shinella sumterensis]|uniref:sigma-70 family RNA polymerase sigma factor n=1 Tax=Shinella sumterensis TaxID=1967501 RepID=UPI00106EBDDE|nr:sigma-70 family RNA polymerase sigma factor [Shinella sumterensis]MCD1264022.1 hypothetical protein [Shinella sumterensis]TFE99438.1 hypothetical protein B5M44_04360 [Shinella sumterensis]